jgi:hypothetical protein
MRLAFVKMHSAFFARQQFWEIKTDDPVQSAYFNSRVVRYYGRRCSEAANLQT